VLTYSAVPSLLVLWVIDAGLTLVPRRVKTLGQEAL
jgi:hypothetical protein